MEEYVPCPYSKATYDGRTAARLREQVRDVGTTTDWFAQYPCAHFEHS